MSCAREYLGGKPEIPGTTKMENPLVTPTWSSFDTAVTGIRGGLRDNVEF